MPFFPTTLTKHQAFAPSESIPLFTKIKLVKVEFPLRPSAKAFESSSWIDQTLGPLSHPFLLENLSGCCTVVSVWNMVSFIFSHLSHQVWPKLIDQKQPSRDIRTYQIDIQAHPSRSDHHKQPVKNQNHHASIRICICPWNMLGQSIWEHTFKLL